MPLVHVVGAGLAGLSCAVRLADRGVKVWLYEASGQAGGRCRSYFDDKLGCQVDNGNHLLLSANRAALAYLDLIGAGDSLIGPKPALLPFVDLASGESWALRPSAGRLPWWLLSRKRRIPGTGIFDYLAAWRLAKSKATDRVTDCLTTEGPLWHRFWEPLTVAVLNTAPEEASARLLWSVVAEIFAEGEASSRPLVAKDGLGVSFVDPAINFLKIRQAEITFDRRLRRIEFGSSGVKCLEFAEEKVSLAPEDWLVLAVPPAVLSSLLPDVQVPRQSRPIVNAHIRLSLEHAESVWPWPNCPVLGIVGGTAQWLFRRGEIVSVTVSAAEGLVNDRAEVIADRLWHDAARALKIENVPLPPIRIVKEKRATFAQTPDELRRRPGAETAWPRLLIAGDWTDTGIPATIESAVRSGNRAADLITIT